jgi:ATP-binding cassette subfamily B protein/subfamily B ATP-binding cassette protein MsbA
MNRWWLKLGRYALPQARGLALILCLLLIGVGLSLLAPWPLKLIVDNVLADKPLPSAVAWLNSLPGAGSPTGLLAWLAAATVGLFFANRLATVLRTYVEAGVGYRMTYTLATDLFNRLQRYSLQFHHRQRSGDLVKRITSDTSCVRTLVMDVCVPALTSLVTLMGMFFIMWPMSRGLALFALGLSLPLALIIKRFAGPMSERQYQEQQLQGEIYSLAEQMLSAIPIVQAFGREHCEEKRFRGLAHRTVQAQFRAELSSHQFWVSSGAVTAIATGVLMVFGGLSVLRGDLSLGSLIVLIAYFAALYAPIETMAYLSESFALAHAGARRVWELLASDIKSVCEIPGARPLCCGGPPRGMSIRFENVTFGYETGRPVFQEVFFEVEPGEIVALVGPTGAGKTTLVSLIPRLFDPWEGTVYVHGVDVRRVQLSQLRDSIAIVHQDPFVLPLSVVENIGYRCRVASRAQIIAAAQAARAHDFIEKLPRGYDTVLGERGVTLSAGQRQRLSIARALLEDTPILLLDEPTSALDPQTEACVVDEVSRLFAGRTIFVVAHRYSTIQRANKVIVLERGAVVKVGTPRELLGTGIRFNQPDQSPHGQRNLVSANESCA